MSWKSTALAAAVTAAVTPAALAADNPLTADIAGHATVRDHMRAAQRAQLRSDLRNRARELGAPRRQVRGETITELRELIRDLKAERARERQFASAGASPVLESIAACESGGNPAAVSSDGTYRGKYQFSYETWAAMGGSGDPAAASEAEQDYRAARLYETAGPGQWPVCGR
jgi:hypothetical protein